MWAGHPDGFLKVNPGWAGHPDGFLQVKSSSRLSGELCCCVSFWFWREIGIFFVVAGKFYYDRKKSSSRLAITTEKKSSSRLYGGLCCCVSFWFWREIGSCLSWRESFITTEKK
jgi:hypothetical protein